jgi:hypothetical protein
MAATAKLPSLPEELENLVLDACRFAEGVLTQQQVRKRHPFGDDVWEALGANEDFCEMIEDLRLQRVRSGACKRELAQKHVVASPNILNDIMRNPQENARHRIDASKLLDQFAEPPRSQDTPQTDRFIIRIDLSADARLKSVPPNPADIITINAEMPRKPIPVIERKDDE